MTSWTRWPSSPARATRRAAPTQDCTPGCDACSTRSAAAAPRWPRSSAAGSTRARSWPGSASWRRAGWCDAASEAATSVFPDGKMTRKLRRDRIYARNFHPPAYARPRPWQLTSFDVSERPIPAVLSIAGSDSGGGAGIQADLKAFARCGVHGMTAITALTAQNTVAVTGIQPVPGDFIVAQVRAVADDIGVDAVKIGMLGTAETVHAVRKALDLLQPETPIVLDPVMVAESGAVLLDGAARAAIVAELLPRATVITPNVPEARVLAATADED